MDSLIKILLRNFVLVMIVISLHGCTKECLEDELPYITFGVSGLDVDTKGLITGDNITSRNIYVYGVRNNTTNVFNKEKITKNQNNSNWETTTKRQWVAGSSYSFYAITSSPEALNSTPTTSGVYVENSGLKITVAQPNEYTEDDMVDYMLSHAYKVADGSSYHTVMLYMQHAVSWVNIEVVKEMAEHVITLNSITLSNIFRQATMQCESQAIANSNGNNVWSTQLSGTNNTSYTKSSFTSNGNTLGTMSILAVPQQLGSSTTLSVNYTVTESGGNKTYTQTFNLFNYTPYVWEPGHKITYTLSINTGVSLKAAVADWIDAGYTEGLILPPSNTSN